MEMNIIRFMLTMLLMTPVGNQLCLKRLVQQGFNPLFCPALHLFTLLRHKEFQSFYFHTNTTISSYKSLL